MCVQIFYNLPFSQEWYLHAQRWGVLDYDHFSVTADVSVLWSSYPDTELEWLNIFLGKVVQQIFRVFKIQPNKNPGKVERVTFLLCLFSLALFPFGLSCLCLCCKFRPWDDKCCVPGLWVRSKINPTAVIQKAEQCRANQKPVLWEKVSGRVAVKLEKSLLPEMSHSEIFLVGLQQGHLVMHIPNRLGLEVFGQRRL